MHLAGFRSFPPVFLTQNAHMPPRAPAPTSGDRAAVEVYRGSANCRRRLVEILEENKLPTGLLPFRDGILELGYHRDSGFVWVKQKERRQYHLPESKLTVFFDAEVAGYLRPSGMKKIRGVAAKELFLTLNAEEFSVKGGPVDGQVHFKTAIGLSRVVPASALFLPED